MDEDIPLETREHRKPPVTFTRNLNNDMARAVMTDARMNGEYIPGMVKESTVWDVYNNEARKVDNELVKDWTASLNFLLVFAAIFAAVLTAFIIESKKMLEQDQTEVLVDIAIQYLNSIGTQSRNNLTRPDFEPTFEAISINCLLFASLGASLVAALASVVALQWVADYDAAITRGGSSPEDRAKRRQFRHAGVVGWKMGEMIAALPILLYASVVLFWAGAIQWMWTLNHTVGYVVAGGTALAVLFYASTTILAAVYVSAPFRTPLSRGLYWAIGPSASTVRRLVSWIPFKIILRRVAVPFGAARLPSLFRDSAAMQWIAKHFLPGRTSRYQEDQAAEQDPSVASDALAWLAQQLPISADSYERLLLCVSGIPGLSPENPPSPSFYTTPWLTILDFLSKHFMTQIVDRKSSNHDYQGVGILMQCIDSPFIRSNVVPDASYIRNPREVEYWGQYCLVKDGTLDLGTMRQAPMAFLLARDVPVPSCGSKYELEATWKLIRWRNSISLTGSRFNRKLRTYDIWPNIFSDIRGYSPEFFEACLCHFRVWTTIPPYSFPSETPDYAVMFDSVFEQALHRELSINELLALVRAFAGYLSASQSPEIVDETNIVRQPLSYALAVGWSSEATRARHLTITLLVVQVARSLVRTEALRWARWIALMLWIASPKDPVYLNALSNSIVERTPNLWAEIETSSTSVAIQGPHVAEVARILWRVDNGMMMSLSRDAFTDPRSLRHLDLLLQWVPHCHAHRTGSQHILVHLYESAERDSQKDFHVRLRVPPVGLESVDWTYVFLNPILAMLALSDDQDLSYLQFYGPVGLECAGRILEAVKAVKMQPVELVCLLTDIISTIDRESSWRNLVLILELVKRAMEFMDEEPITPLLCPMASGVERIQQLVVVPAHRRDHLLRERGVREAQQICIILQAKYAARFISSTTQLRVQSCARSAAVEQPEMGWLRMHEPL